MGTFIRGVYHEHRVLPGEQQDDWQPDTERISQQYFLQDRYVRSADKPSAWPEYAMLAGLGVVFAVILWAALRIIP